MVVAILTADRESVLGALNGSGEKGLTDILPIIYLMPLTWLISFGAGPISADYLLSRLIGKRNAAASVSLAKAAA